MLTTEQLRARAESLELDFFIERRAGIWVKEWLNDGCTSATAEEVMMWSMLANREAQPGAWQETLSRATKAFEALLETAGNFDKEVWADVPAQLRAITAPPAPAVPEKKQELDYNPSMSWGDQCVAIAEIRGWNACRAAMLDQPVSSGYKLPDDTQRMDWLVAHHVTVRKPLRYGSEAMFTAQTITDEEDEYHATKLREQIDAAMLAAAPENVNGA